MEKVKFAILSTQRSGSTLIYSSLASHPQIKCLGEIFLPEYKAEFSYFEHVRQKGISRPLALIRRNSLVDEFLDRLYSSSTEVATGFKYMYSHSWYVPYRFPMAMTYMKENNVRILHLVRENTLKVCVSRQVARPPPVLSIPARRGNNREYEWIYH